MPFLALLLSAALSQAQPAPGTPAWVPVGLSGGGAMFSPAISSADPNLMLVNCDMGAAYLSRDGGQNWQMIHYSQLRSDTGCRPGFHPADPKVIYASSAGQLRRSGDAGRTFAPHGNLPQALQGEIRLNPAHPATMIAGTRGGRCIMSRDSGATWLPQDGPAGKFIGFHFDQTQDGQTIFAASDQGIWRSADGGGSWRSVSGALPWTPVQGFAAASDRASGVVILYCSIESRAVDGQFAGGIYKSVDRAETWAPVPGSGLNKDLRAADEWAHDPIAQYHQLLAADARPQTVYAFNTGTGFHPPHHETVFRSDDAGETWRPTYFQDPRFKQFNVGLDYVLGSTGQSFKGGGVPFGVAICGSDPARVLLVLNEAHVTHNGGRSWINGSARPAPNSQPQPGSSWLCNGQVVTTTWHYHIDPHEPARHYIAYTDIGFARSTDAGRSWIWWDKKSWAPWRNTCYELAFDPDVPGLIWGAFSNVHDIPNDNIISERHGSTGPGGVCLSRDFGASWQHEARGLPLKPVTSVVIDPGSPRDARVLFAGVFEGGVFKSTNSGAAWHPMNDGLGHPANMRVARVILQPDGTLFASICAKRPARGQPLIQEGVGLYRSAAGAGPWQKIDSGEWRYIKDFSVDPRDSRRILVGVCDAGGSDRSGGLYATRDGGTSWRRLARQGPQTFGGYFHPSRPGWIYMTLTEGAPGPGLWLSRNDGETWQPFHELPFANIQRVSFDPQDEDTIYATTFGGSVWKGPARPD